VVSPPSEVAVDLRDGGRWTSLRLGGREWLWAGPGLHSGARHGLTAYVDVGGLDECLPTVRGVPDHGVLWSRAWSDGGDFTDVAYTEDFVLSRRLDARAGTIRAEYRLEAEPGYRFVWAAHALLDCAVGARVLVPDSTRCRIYPEAASFVGRPWPDGAAWVEETWAGLGLATYGESDGSAAGAVLLDCPASDVEDRGQVLRFELSCPGQPVSAALWRNLGGFGAYRSLGVEPMLGRVFDLAEAGPGDAAVVPPSGVLTWRLSISARS
jgi:hypothetical protein